MSTKISEMIEGAVGAVLSPVISGIASFNRWRLPPRDAPHPFLTGVHAPMAEELTLHDLPVEGVLPPELDGRYVRIGPNAAAPDPAHLPLLRRRRHVARRAHSATGGRSGTGTAGFAPTRSPRRAACPPHRGPRHIFDTVNTSILDHAGTGWALVEAGSTPVSFGEELDEQRYQDFGGTLPGSFSAHPRRDPATGELHALCYEANDLKRVRYKRRGPERPSAPLGYDPG